MDKMIKLEELFLLLLSLLLFWPLDYAWWWFLLLFLAPDLGMLGYLWGPRAGAITYNLAHHKAVAIGLYALGFLAGSQFFQLIGLILLGHSSFDRILGYGLKYPDSFQHTHLGWIGEAAPTRSPGR